MSSNRESVAGQVGDVDPLDLVAGDDCSEIRRTAPIAHGAGISVVLDDDVDLYDSLRQTWREAIGEPGVEALVEADIDWLPDGDYVWRFFSSNWKAGRENGSGTWKRWYDYQVRLRRRETDPETGDVELVKPPVTLSVIVEPQVDDLTYSDGGDVSLPFGEGSRLRIKSTYTESLGSSISRHRAFALTLTTSRRWLILNNPAHEAVDGGFECERCGATRSTPLGMARHRELCRQTNGGCKQ